MAATVFKASSASNLEFGTTNETGIILTSYNRTVNAEKTEVRDAENEVVAVAYSGLTAAITLTGFINGSVTMQVANTLSLTNDTSLGGLTGGTVIVDSVAFATSQGEFSQVTVNATQYGETMTSA
jgi:hypothetical protein